MSNAEIIVSLLLAIVLGGIVGFQREKRGKAAGMRTHALVTMGATLFTLLSRFGFGYGPGTDPSRIASQIVVGIGFLGAGIILHGRNNHILGVTTAAGLWASAALGMAIGVGWYAVAMVATVFILTIFILDDHWFTKHKD